MFKRKRNAFTLIELVATLVIMAIIALIVTPLVMNIIRKARIAADKRSVDAYGRSIELAIAGYLMDNGSFPTSIEQLTIEYSGDEVVCSTTNLNSDSSVYLAGCTVGGRSVEGYTYGKEESVPTPSYTAYSVGDEVTYNNVDYYVIKDSSASEKTVTMLKAEPLSVAEVNQYGVGHVNRYTYNSVGTAYDLNGYGGLAYYTSETCGYVNNASIETGCITDYDQSEIKYVVDAWKMAKSPDAIEVRLITFDEIVDNFNYERYAQDPSNDGYRPSENTPSWVYNTNYFYWTMSQKDDSLLNVWYVSENGRLYELGVSDSLGLRYAVVRPVIVLPKSAISS